MAGDFALRALLGTPDGARGWGTWNWSKYSNKRLDAEIRQSLCSTDPLQRQRHAAGAMEIAMNDYAVLPLHHQFASWAMRSGVSYLGRLDEFTLAHQFRPV
jgi:peptide/nickel transport system substrate-binding protein